MPRGVNKVILIGNLGQDPEVRFMPSGDPVANISIATTETWTDKQSGQKNEKTEWHKCNAFGKLAEIMQQYLKKGSKVYIEGSLHTRKWQDQSGVDRYSTEIKIRDLQMLDSPGGQQQGQQGGHGGQQTANQAQGGQQQGNYGPGPDGYQRHQAAYAQQQGQQQGQQRQAQQGNYGAPDPGSFDDFSDEIPF